MHTQKLASCFSYYINGKLIFGEFGKFKKFYLISGLCNKKTQIILFLTKFLV